MLERLDAVEDHERPLAANELGQAQATVPSRASGRILVAEPTQGVVDEGVRGRQTFFGALAIERPAVDATGAAPAVGAQRLAIFLRPIERSQAR